MADDSDSDDNTPLAYIRGTSEDDIPLIHLRKVPEVSVSSCSSDESSDEIMYDSDQDPEFNVGVCEVRKCKEEVWAACHECEILVCFDHFNEDISSCWEHGKTKKRKQNERPGDSKTNKQSTAAANEQCDSVDHLNSTELGENVNMQPEQFIVEGSAKESKVQRTVKINKQVEAKAKRNRGEEYISPSTKKKVPQKEMKPRCQGSKKCGRKCDTIADEERKKIFKAYYDLGDLRLQREYIVRHVEVFGVHRKRSKGEPSRRGITKKYFLTINGQATPVCQKFFLNTLGISEQTARTAFSKLSQTGTLEDERRGGRQSKTVIARDAIIQEAVRNHINRFPRVESHFCRSSTSREYLNSDLTVQKMYAMFLEDWSPKPNPPTLRYYEKTFKEMNLSIHRPKKDQCSLCMHVHQSKKDSIPISDELEERFKKHIAEKTKVRELKDISKKKALENKNVRCGTFDLQQVIYLPKSLESAIFYKRRLSNYNFTFYDLSSRLCHSYTWHEGVSKRGASEITSAVYKALQLYDEDGVNEIHLYSDGCSGQNKNSIMPAMMLYSIMNSKNIQEISLRYFESFHGQNEGDSVHSSISTALKKAGNLFTPSQLVPVFSLARRNNIVHQLQYEDFSDFKLLSKDLRILNARNDSEDGIVPWNSIMELKVNRMHPNTIFYKTSHLDLDYSELPLKRLKDNYLQNYVLKKLNTEPNKLSKEKYKDLMSLCSGDVPVIRNQEHKEFYRNLPHY